MVFDFAGDPNAIVVELMGGRFYSFNSFAALPQLARSFGKTGVFDRLVTGLYLFVGSIKVVMIVLMDLLGLIELEVFVYEVEDLLDGLRSANGVMILLDD